MPLTAAQQQQILAGTIAPPEVVEGEGPEILFKDLVKIELANEAADFIGNQKTIDATVEAQLPAYEYFAKYSNVLRLVLRGDTAILNGIYYLMVGKIGAAATTEAITNATTAQWEAFVDVQLESCIEIIAGTTPTQRAAYQALP